MEQHSLALKYRPESFETLLGHTEQVARLKGIIKSGKIPAAFLFTGTSSTGKTTLARAFAREMNKGKLGPDYKEMNAADQRGIDDMRELIRLSKLRPMSSKKRIFVVDEAQQLISNAAAAQLLLKPIEEPSPDTVWIFCSMDPAKFTSGTGRAIANRCVQFALEPHTEADLMKQAQRIVKGEDMKYMLAKSDDKKEKYALLQTIVENCNGEMRTLANIIQAAQQYYEGMDEKPKRLKASDISAVLKSGQSNDDALAAEFMASIFTYQYGKAQVALLDVADSFSFVRKVVGISRFYLNNSVLGGKKHSKVWWTNTNRQFLDIIKKAGVKHSLGQIAAVNEAMVNAQAQSASFAVDAVDLLSAVAYRTIVSIKPKEKS